MPQPIQCGFNRSDYMFHYDEEKKEIQPKQVEINMISTSLASFSTATHQLHKYLMGRYPEDFETIYKGYSLEETNSKENLPHLLATAHNIFGKGEIILFVTQKSEKSFDQVHTEQILWKTHQIKVESLTMEEIHQKCKIENNNLTLNGKIISVVYFRAGYSPDDYHGNEEWEARKLIEKSHAIKCPSIVSFFNDI